MRRHDWFAHDGTRWRCRRCGLSIARTGTSPRDDLWAARIVLMSQGWGRDLDDCDLVLVRQVVES